MKVKPKPRNAERLRIEYLPIKKLLRAPRNPKQHDLGALHESFGRNGYIAPIIINDATGRIVAGHGRLDALQQLKASGAPAPDRVQVTKTDWLVPVVRGVNFASDADAEAYVIGDNQLTMLGGWDDAALAQMLSDLAAQDSLLGTGFDSDDLDNMLRDLGQNGQEGLTDPDAVPDPPAIPITKPGDLWQLGTHRMLCGDSAQERDLKQVMGDEKPDACIMDPPYGMDWNADASRFTGGKFGNHPRGRERDNVINDDQPFDPAPFLKFKTVVIWGLNHFCGKLPPGGVLVWIKKPDERFGTFLSDCELAWTNIGCGVYAIRHHWGGITRESERGEFLHPTQKPAAVVTWTMEKTKSGKIVLDPFLGSGTTLIACERTGRRCYGLEIDPGYCDVIVARWEQFTGQKAVRA